MLPFAKLVIATHNGKKATEMVQILSETFPELQILTLADYPDAPEPQEVGSTYGENAAIKSQSAAAHTGEWSLADDAGLEVDALGGIPGLHSKRFEGEDTPFPVKIAKLLDRMKDVPEQERTARFRCSIALSRPHGATDILEATCEGRIAREPSGNNGFGYDPIFFLPELGCTMAELAPEQKHRVSHRGKVLRKLAHRLSETREQGFDKVSRTQ